MNSTLLPIRRVVAFSALAVLLTIGCETNEPGPAVSGPQDGPGERALDLVDVTFLERVESNRENDGSVNGLEFVDTKGERVQIRQYRGEKNLVLVFTRGFAGHLCPYCTTQTSRLIANYEEFQARDAEVLLVYPGSKDQLPQFQQAGLAASGFDQFPFPVLLDEDLVAVDQLGIAAQLASPSTFIIDKEGKVRLSYVGSNPADRPSIKAILEQLDRLQEEPR